MMPMMVTTMTITFISACLQITIQVGRPLALAVRMKSCLKVSTIAERVMRASNPTCRSASENAGSKRLTSQSRGFWAKAT